MLRPAHMGWFVVAAVLLLGALGGNHPAAAQSGSDFDSEFDDEFDEPVEEPAEPPAQEPDEPAVDVPAGESAETAESATVDADASHDDETESDEVGADSESSEGEAETEEEPVYHDPRDNPQDAVRLRMFNSYLGPTGGLHVVDALNPPAGTFRIQLGIEFFAKNGFLRPEDEQSRVGGALSLSWSVHDLVELYASTHTVASSNRTIFPNLLIVLGDVLLGAKVGGPISSVLSLGGDLGFRLPTGSSLGVGLSGLGIDLRALLTADFRGLESKFPLIARFNLAYRFDRTERLIGDVEDARYAVLADPLPREDETRHLITAPERFALNINRTDFFSFGLGFEVPIEVRSDIHVAPLLEWKLDIPVNRQGYDCPFVPAEPGGDTPREGDDSCLAEVGGAAFPQTLSLGVRVLPPVEGLGVFAGVDIGLTGREASQAVRELAATPAWRILLGLSYAHDARGPRIPPPEIRHRDIEVEVPPELPPKGRIVGRVVNNDGSPVPGAIVAYPEENQTNQLGNDEGRFVSYQFDPGAVHMSVSADGHHQGSCSATIPEDGGDVEVTCTLQPQLVAIEDEQVVILEQIQFALDSAEILPESFELMRQIRDALRDHPEIAMVEIQGHTDDQGTHEYNAQLSQARAESVQAWLLQNGIDQGRLRAAGYGETRPLVNDTTDEARASNRRVEFRILQRQSAVDGG